MSLEKSLSIQSGLESVAGKEIKEEAIYSSESFYQKVCYFVKNITVEPVMLCYTLPSVMASLTIQNLNLEKACRVNLNFTDDICTALAARNLTNCTEPYEKDVQKLVVSMNAWKNIIQSVLPAIVLIFLGSWSDRNKRRKPCMILPIIGELTTSFCFILCTYFFYLLPLEFNALAEAVPPAITGGWFAMSIGVFSYISNISTPEKRTLRIGAVNMFNNVSVTIGIALSGILYKYVGFYGVFILSISLYTTAILYVIFHVKEVPKDDVVGKEEEVEKKSFLKDFFDTKHVVDTFKVAFKKGERNRKKRICVIMFLVMVIIGPLHGELNVVYLFVRYKFKWNELDYSIYCTVAFLLHLTGTMFNLAFFTKYLKCDDAILGIVSNTSKILSCFVFAFAPNTVVFYIGAVVEMFNGTSFIAMRSIMSKLVDPDELGKINSLFGVCEAFMPLIYGPMYSLTYKATLDWLPGLFFILGGVLTMPAVFIFFWLYLENSKDEKEQKNVKKEQKKLLDEENSRRR